MATCLGQHSASVLSWRLSSLVSRRPTRPTTASPTAVQGSRLDTYQAVTTRIAEWRAKGVNVSENHVTVESVDREAAALQTNAR